MYAVSNAQFNFKAPQIDDIRADMVWWQQDVERPLTLELRWVMEPSVAVLVEVWTATYTATAAPPSLDESALLRETYKRLTLFMRGLYTTLRALPATQVRNVERHIAFVFFFIDCIFCARGCASQLYQAGLSMQTAFRQHFTYRLLISDPRRPSQSASVFPDAVSTDTYDFPPITSPLGTLAVAARYRSDCKRFLPPPAPSAALSLCMIERYMDGGGECDGAGARAGAGDGANVNASAYWVAAAAALPERTPARTPSRTPTRPSSPSVSSSSSSSSSVSSSSSSAALSSAATSPLTAVTVTPHSAFAETYGVSVSPLYPTDIDFLTAHGMVRYHTDALNFGVVLLVFASLESASAVRSAFMSQGRQVGFIVSGASIAASVHYSPPCSVATQLSPPGSMFASPMSSAPSSTPRMPPPFELPESAAAAMAMALSPSSSPPQPSLLQRRHVLPPLRRTIGFSVATAAAADVASAIPRAADTADEVAELLRVIAECRASPPKFVTMTDARLSDSEPDVSL